MWRAMYAPTILTRGMRGVGIDFDIVGTDLGVCHFGMCSGGTGAMVKGYLYSRTRILAFQSMRQ